MIFKRNRFDSRFMKRPTQLYYQNGHGLNMYGDNYMNTSRFNYQQAPQDWHSGGISHNPYLHHPIGVENQSDYNSWNQSPTRVDDLHYATNKVEQPSYYGYENYQDSSNIIGNPLIHDEVSFRPQGQAGNLNQFSNEPFSAHIGDKLVKKTGAFKSVMDQFKSDNGTVDFNKMVGTTSQLASAINQITGFVKGVSGIFKVAK